VLSSFSLFAEQGAASFAGNSSASPQAATFNGVIDMLNESIERVEALERSQIAVFEAYWRSN
jgi:hypothetical protein